MRNFLIVLVSLIDLLANVPYIKDVIKGKSKPNIASWSTWTLVNIITVVAAIAAGEAFNTVALGATFLAGSFAILLLGLYHGTRKYTWFDGICQAIALTGVVLWQLAGNPNIALLFVLIVDIFASAPTVRHAFLYPHEETWMTFFIAAISAIILLLLAPSRTFAALAIPIDAVVINSLITGTIVVRGRQLKPPVTSHKRSSTPVI